MNERRRFQRRRPDVAMSVTDAMSGRIMGLVGNLSLEGMLLITPNPFVDGGLYQFTFQLPDAHGRPHTLEVGMQAQWTTASNVPGQNWIGLRFIDVSDPDLDILRGWLAAG